MKMRKPKTEVSIFSKRKKKGISNVEGDKKKGGKPKRWRRQDRTTEKISVFRHDPDKKKGNQIKWMRE